MKDVGRGSAEVISAIRIVSVPLYLFSWNANKPSVLSAFCVDAAVNVLDFRRVTVRIVATANRWIVGHVPRRIELPVQELVLRRVTVKPGILRLDRHHKREAKTDALGRICRMRSLRNLLTLRSSEPREFVS
jgi:hypothetical protein